MKQVLNDLQVKNQKAGSSQYMLGNPAAAEKAIRGLTLRVNRFASPNICNFSRHHAGIERNLRLERVALSIFLELFGLLIKWKRHFQVVVPRPLLADQRHSSEKYAKENSELFG
ncbi:MAG: hypothetical protein WAN12_08300 [Candidatus Acidiferrum sp.]